MKSAIVLIVLGVFSLTAAVGQTKLSGIGEEGDWIIFKKLEEPVFCGIMAEPESSVYTRNGKAVEVNRGDHRMAISLPEGSLGLLAYEAGFPLKGDITVDFQVDGKKFTLYTDPSGKVEDYAWPLYTEDKEIVSALKLGSKAKVTATSTRGTKVIDTFSLRGVTKGLQRAAETCGN